MKVQIVVATLLLACLCESAACAADTGGAQVAETKSQMFELEGTLRVHPKFLYRYYINGFGDGQACALFGEERLKEIKPGSLIHVTGRLGTRFHSGGNEKNPSPFPSTWYIYMDVETVKVLRGPEPKAAEPSGRGPPGTTPRVREAGAKAPKARVGGRIEIPIDLTSFSRILAFKIRAATRWTTWKSCSAPD